MKLLSRDQIIAAQDLDFRDVPVPEWGEDCGVRIRAGSGEERDAFDEDIMTGNGPDRKVNVRRLRVKLLVRAIVDETGKPLFTESDLEALDKKNARVSWRLFRIAQSLWGMSQQDVDELLGESKAGPSSELGTGSPANGATLTLVTSAAN